MDPVTNDPAQWISTWTSVRKHGDQHDGRDPDLSNSNLKI